MLCLSLQHSSVPIRTCIAIAKLNALLESAAQLCALNCQTCIAIARLSALVESAAQLCALTARVALLLRG